METSIPRTVFLGKAADLIGLENCLLDPQDLSPVADNSLGMTRSLAGVVRPKLAKEVSELVILAAESGIALYPVSQGRNMGYGDRAPVRDDCVLLDLSRMNAIRDYDPDLGYVRVEPGVTQQQLFDFLKSNNSPFWMDATGAGKEASIVGNTLEGGFGHTPLGNHRDEFCDAEVVLGTGETIRTGVFPRTGPDLRGMFVQSNFGVVTSMRIPLMRAPESFCSFIVKCREPQGLAPMVEALRLLRQQGVVKSCVHMGNPMRYLISSKRCPPEFLHTLLDDDDAIKIMTSPLISVGRWNAAGSLYGLRKVVKIYQSSIRQAFKGIGAVQFFSDHRVSRLISVFETASKYPLPLVNNILESLKSFQSIQDMMKGVPTDEAYRNILWKVQDPRDLGLIWFAPVVDARGAAAARIVDLATPLYKRFGFEMPLTLTLVTADRLVGILSITFNKHDPEQTKRAHDLYKALYVDFHAQGIRTYRTSVLHMATNRPDPNEATAALSRLKKALDPSGIISPGRYWIAP